MIILSEKLGTSRDGGEWCEVKGKEVEVADFEEVRIGAERVCNAHPGGYAICNVLDSITELKRIPLVMMEVRLITTCIV